MVIRIQDNVVHLPHFRLPAPHSSVGLKWGRQVGVELR